MSPLNPRIRGHHGRFATMLLAAFACPAVSPQDLDNVLARPGKPVTVKFFASWCGSCKDDLEALRGKPRDESLILLSAYDDEASAAETLKHFDVRQACFKGDALARKLGVKHLPYSFVFKGESR